MTTRRRHIACRSCRERKIRCDGNEPCSRCAGQLQTCVYSTAANPEPGNWEVTQLLQVMNDRLVRAEAQLATQAYTGVGDVLPSADFNYWGGTPIQTSNTCSPSWMPAPSVTSFPFETETSSSDWPSDVFAAAPGLSQTSNGSSTSSSSFQVSQPDTNESLFVPQKMKIFQECFFDSVNLLFPMLDRSVNMDLPSATDLADPWKSSLHSAICTHGAMISQDTVLEKACYLQARQELEKADRKEPSAGFLRIEALQAWILIGLYEFRRAFFASAWISHGRYMRLVQVMGLHQLDQDGSRGSSSQEAGERLAEEKDVELERNRITFWVAYLLDCLNSIAFGGGITIVPGEITTLLPTYIRSPGDKFKQRPMTIKEALQIPSLPDDRPFTTLIVMATVCGQILSHTRRARRDDIGEQLRYEFWANHYAFDSMLTRLDTCLQESGILLFCSDPNTLFFNAVRHAAAISLYQSAAIRASNTSLPTSLVESLDQKCKSAALEIAGIVRVMFESNSSQNIINFNPFIVHCIYAASGYLVCAVQAKVPDAALLDSMEGMLQALNHSELKARNPCLNTFVSRIFKDVQSMQKGVSEKVFDSSQWLLNEDN